jgi:hypothetical protein
MNRRRKQPWESLPKRTPGKAAAMNRRRKQPQKYSPKRTPGRRRRQKAWWEYALMILFALIAGMIKGMRTPPDDVKSKAAKSRRRGW